MTNDHFADATKVVVASDGDTVTMPSVSNTGFSTDTVASSDNAMFRDAWWSYALGHAGEVIIDVDQSTPSPDGIRVEVYTGATLADLFPTSDNGVSDDTSTGNVDTNLGTGRIYIRVAVIDDIDTTYVLRVHGPASAGDGTDTHATAGITVDMTAEGVFTPPGTLTATAAITVDFAATATYPHQSLTSGHGTAYPGSLVVATITAELPADGAGVPGLRPFFAVDVVTTQRNLNAYVDYDTDPTFPAPTTVSTPVVPGQSVLHELLRATSPLVDGTVYYWRAYVGNSNDRSDYTTTRTFTVSAVDGDGVIGCRWDISHGTTPIPHLWFVHPSRAAPGHSVTANGTGFGPTTVTASVNGISATVTNFQAADPGSAAYTDQRAIIPGTGLADPYHQMVTLTVPDSVDPPGGVLYLDGS